MKKYVPNFSVHEKLCNKFFGTWKSMYQIFRYMKRKTKNEKQSDQSDPIDTSDKLWTDKLWADKLFGVGNYFLLSVGVGCDKSKIGVFTVGVGWNWIVSVGVGWNRVFSVGVVSHFIFFVGVGWNWIVSSDVGNSWAKRPATSVRFKLGSC